MRSRLASSLPARRWAPPPPARRATVGCGCVWDGCGDGERRSARCQCASEGECARSIESAAPRCSSYRSWSPSARFRAAHSRRFDRRTVQPSSADASRGSSQDLDGNNWLRSAARDHHLFVGMRADPYSSGRSASSPTAAL